MRYRAVLAAALALLPALVAADPILPAAGWADGEGHRFELSWNGSVGTFTVDQVGTTSFTTLNDCCGSMFQSMQQQNPYGSFLVSQLSFNTMPINTTFIDDLNLGLMSNQLHNLRTLTGLVTLELPPDLRRERPVLVFGSPDSPFHDTQGLPPAPERHSSVPEPTTLLMVGMGMFGLSRALRRRR